MTEEDRQRHERQLQSRETRTQLFRQTFDRVIWLNVAALAAIVAALQNEVILDLIAGEPAADFVRAAVIGFGISLTLTLLIPIWRAWWSVKHPADFATATYVIQQVAALLTGLSVLLAAWGLVTALLG
jgi:hypothetical protein